MTVRESSDSRDAQVIIVGGGPVGLGLAIELGQRGIRCTVIERYAHPQPVPKGQNLTQRTLEHFYFWRAERELRAARTIPPEYGIGGLTAYGTLLGQYSYDWLQRELVRPFYFTDNERLPQYATEEVLRRRVAELPTVQTVYGWGVESIEQNEDGVSVGIAQRDGVDSRTLHAQYVVGCDGTRSIVREQTGITQTRSDHDRLMVLLVFRAPGLHQLLERYPGKSYYNVLHPELEGYWKFFGRVDLGTSWFFHAPVPLGTTEDNFDFRRYLWDAVGAEFDVEFDYIGFWDLRFALADQYRAGRVFIAGDACHSHPPYGGYGINTGFEDAVNLGWKLAAELHGWAGPGLLDSYDEERRPVFASTSQDFIEKAIFTDKEFLANFDPARDRAAFEHEWARRGSGAVAEVGAFEPNYEGSSIVWSDAPGPGGSAVGSHVFAARAGHHLAPQPLSSGQNVFEALGEDFTLLGFDADSGTLDAFEAEAKKLGLDLKVVRDSRDGGRERYEADLVLVRPDQFVAWASGSGDAVDPAEVLRKAVGCPEASQ
jgi:2-polyprenyl-6-methoxyphenol hydroxylase-like FAD-dependent oxidoreductase